MKNIIQFFYQSDDKNYNSVYVLNHNNSEVYVSAKYADQVLLKHGKILSHLDKG
jgi:adenylate cyclase